MPLVKVYSANQKANAAKEKIGEGICAVLRNLSLVKTDSMQVYFISLEKGCFSHAGVLDGDSAVYAEVNVANGFSQEIRQEACLRITDAIAETGVPLPLISVSVQEYPRNILMSGGTPV